MGLVSSVVVSNLVERMPFGWDLGSTVGVAADIAAVVVAEEPPGFRGMIRFP